MIVVGLPEKEIQIAPFSLVSARHSLAGSAIGGIRETQEMLDFCSRNNIACDIELIRDSEGERGLRAGREQRRSISVRD